jgi:hypothetical protein
VKLFQTEFVRKQLLLFVVGEDFVIRSRLCFSLHLLCPCLGGNRLTEYLMGVGGELNSTAQQAIGVANTAREPELHGLNLPEVVDATEQEMKRERLPRFRAVAGDTAGCGRRT